MLPKYLYNDLGTASFKVGFKKPYSILEQALAVQGYEFSNQNFYLLHAHRDRNAGNRVRDYTDDPY